MDEWGAYKSLQAAVDAARDGQTISVGAGKWEECVVVEGKRIVIAGVAGAEIHGSDSGPALTVRGAFGAVVRGLTLRNASEKQPALPGLEWLNVPSSQRYLVKYNQECNFVQAIEGDIDSSHIGFLHQSTLRLQTSDIGVRVYQLRDKAPRWIVDPTNYGLMLAARRNAEEDSYYWRINHFYFPWYTTIAGSLGSTRGHGHIWVPVDDTHTEVWCVTWSTDEPMGEDEKYRILSGPAPHIASLDPATGKLRAAKANHFLQDREAQRNFSFAGILGTREQDTAVVEGMGAIVDRTNEHLGTSDMAIIGMRRQLLNGAKALLRGQEPAAPYQPELYRVRSWSAVLPRSEQFLDNPQVQQLMQNLV